MYLIVTELNKYENVGLLPLLLPCTNTESLSASLLHNQIGSIQIHNPSCRPNSPQCNSGRSLSERWKEIKENKMACTLNSSYELLLSDDLKTKKEHSCCC